MTNFMKEINEEALNLAAGGNSFDELAPKYEVGQKVDFGRGIYSDITGIITRRRFSGHRWAYGITGRGFDFTNVTEDEIHGLAE